MLSKRAKDMVEFFEEIVYDLMENEVLYPSASYFVAKSQHLNEINRKKHENRNVIDYTPKLDSLRFSPEIAFITHLLY